MPEENKVVKKGWLDKFLDWLERVCNKLPDSTILFIYLFFIILVLGCILGLLGVSATNVATGEVVKVQNPISPVCSTSWATWYPTSRDLLPWVWLSP